MFQNAIAWASIRLRGTWKSYAATTGGYAALIALGFAYFNHMSSITGRGTFAAWCAILFFIQLLILVFGGCSAVGNAVRRDVTSGLLASHRLMPVSPAAAVLGYLFGPTLQALAMAGVNIIAGAASAAMAGIDLQSWFATNLSIMLFVVFLWTCVVFTGFITKSAFGAMFGILFASVGSNGLLLSYVPALGVLLAPIVVSFMTIIRNGGAAKFTVGFGYAIAAQIIFGAILFRGAMRRYRRDDVPALGTRLAFLLLGAWVITSAVGVLRWSDFAIFTPRRATTTSVNVTAQAIAAIVTSMLVALASVSASAKASTDWLRSTLTTGFTPGPRPLPPPALAVLAAALIFPLALGLRPQSSVDPAFQQVASQASLLFALRVAAVAGIYLLSVSYLLRILFRTAGKPFLMIGLWTALTWLIPFGLESARQATAATALDAFFSRISPVGELTEIWTHPDHTSIFGIAVQFLIALVPAALFYSTESKGTRAKPAAAVT